jgi:predicted permease
MRAIDWLLRRRRDADLEDEIHAHLAMAEHDLAASGMDRDAARFAALKEFGNVTLTREATRRSWGEAWRDTLADIVQDIRYAVRVLGRSPAYSLIVIAVLALGIGANVSAFTLFKALALKPVPGVSGSAGLGVLVAQTDAGRILPLSLPDFRDLVAANRSFTAVAGTSMDGFSLGLGARSQRVIGERVTGNYFPVLGVRAHLGRTLLPSDDVTPGGHPVVVLSHGLWQRAFGGDAMVVGTTVQVNGYPLTIVGVIDPAYHGSIVSADTELFVPVMMQPQLSRDGGSTLSNREAPLVWGLGRLAAGASIDSASREASSHWKRISEVAAERTVTQDAIVLPMWRSPFGAQTYMLPAAIALGVMGGLLLIVVCANVSNVVLARGMGRRGEIAARMALGASRGRVLRLLTVESLLLAIPGAALGLAAAQALVASALSGGFGEAAPFRQYLDLSTDWMAVAFAVLLSCGSALLFGFLPALRTSRVDFSSVIKDDLSPRGAARSRARGVLVAAQVAIALPLLIGAALLLRSLSAAQTADVGFDAHGVATLSLDIRPSGYDETTGRTFYERLLQSVRSEPGIESASLAAGLPLTLVDGTTRAIAIEGQPTRRGEDNRVLVNTIAPGYFRTMRIGLAAGRDFAVTDRGDSSRVVIVNETMATRHWGSPEAALGRRLQTSDGHWRTITGVARDIKYSRVTESPRPYVYFPLEQSYASSMVLHARTRDPIAATLDRLRGVVQSLDANLPVIQARPLIDYTRLSLSVFGMASRLLTLFGIIALVLAALGTYGLVAYAAQQSTREIGIRMAIGASRGDVLTRFFGRGLRFGAIGAAGGLVISLATSRAVASLLYGVAATDAVSFSLAAVSVLLVVAAASLIPAWRASRTNPIVALRHG